MSKLYKVSNNGPAAAMGGGLTCQGSDILQYAKLNDLATVCFKFSRAMHLSPDRALWKTLKALKESRQKPSLQGRGLESFSIWMRNLSCNDAHFISSTSVRVFSNRRVPFFEAGPKLQAQSAR